MCTCHVHQCLVHMTGRAIAESVAGYKVLEAGVMPLPVTFLLIAQIHFTRAMRQSPPMAWLLIGLMPQPALCIEGVLRFDVACTAAAAACCWASCGSGGPRWASRQQS